MMFENITIGELTLAMASIGVISAFLYRVFSFFKQVSDNTAKLNIVAAKADANAAAVIAERTRATTAEETIDTKADAVTKAVQNITVRLECVEIKVKQDRDEILDSLDDAKTLFCTGLSVLIDNALNNSNETELIRIKKQLDERKRYD